MAHNELNHEQKMIAESRISFLEKEAQRLRVNLRDKEAFNLAAWKEYGSELCSSSMVVEERKIQSEINQVNANIVLLRKFVEGRLDIFRGERLERNAAEIASQIKTLQDSLSLIVGEQAEIEKVKDLLN